jgi:RimJ/RimL family protein N-acetyltransferase
MRKLRIETERLIITEFTAEMARDVHENSLDEDNRRFVPDEVFETVEEAEETIRFLRAQYGRTEGPQAYAVLTKDGGKNIGYVQMAPIGGGRWEIGYHIAKKYTGRGYAAEAVSAFLPVTAKRIGIDEVYGVCLKDNAASRRVLEKCGFEPEYEGCGEYQGEKREICRTVLRMADSGIRILRPASDRDS